MAGRPTKYSKKILRLTKEYIDSCEDDYIEEEYDEDDERPPQWRKNDSIRVKIPTIDGLAVHLRVARDTLYEWAKVHKEFSYILEQLRAEQADRLINNGLSGTYNSTLAKVLLVKHGYRDAHELTGKDGNKLFDKDAKDKADRAIGDYLGDTR